MLLYAVLGWLYNAEGFTCSSLFSSFFEILVANK
jgi:hypothetical protein